MLRTSALALSLFALLTASPCALAQGNGNGNGNGNSSENGAANGNGGGNGQGNNGNGNGNGGANGVGGGNTGNAGGNGSSGVVTDNGGQQVTVVAPTAGAATTPGSSLTESDVLQAVEAGRAVSLSRILPDVRARTGGEVIDAQLQQVGSFLLYAVKVLTPEGKVTTEFYYARSGLHVER